MRMRDYLTRKYVEKHAVDPASALDLTIKHWDQNCQLSLKQLKRMRKEYCKDYSITKSEPIDTELCGLCIYHSAACTSCILFQRDSSCHDRDSTYGAARAAYEFLVRIQTEAATKLAFEDWQKAAQRMLEVLRSCA